MRGLIFGTVVCAASWLSFALGAGNVGLQRSVSDGPWLLLAEHPLAVPTLVGTAFVVSYLLARRLLTMTALEAGASVLALDLVGSILVAPVLIGELEVMHAPIVFATISFFGMQIAAAAVGASVAARRQVSQAA